MVNRGSFSSFPQKKLPFPVSRHIFLGFRVSAPVILEILPSTKNLHETTASSSHIVAICQHLQSFSFNVRVEVYLNIHLDRCGGPRAIEISDKCGHEKAVEIYYNQQLRWATYPLTLDVLYWTFCTRGQKKWFLFGRAVHDKSVQPWGCWHTDRCTHTWTGLFVTPTADAKGETLNKVSLAEQHFQRE